jgi:4-oxalocrotonate tautomerase
MPRDVEFLAGIAGYFFLWSKFEMPHIQITRVEGRNCDQKRAIARQITDVVEKEGRAMRENIHFTFVDLPPANYAEAGITVEDQRKSAK